jgi:hypothetical protein
MYGAFTNKGYRMEEYTLVNGFMERYIASRGRQKVRSRVVWILKVESLVLKKKRECERDEGEGDTREGL